MGKTIKLYTIGFTKKNAKQFFGLIQDSGVKKVLDTRLNNVSQLAGFTKRDDLAFFLEKVAGVSYDHALKLAPTDDILKGYKKGEISWDAYAKAYNELIGRRHVEDSFSPETLDGACLLCSEASPHHCHRRLAAEFFQNHLGTGVEIIHL
ncbi:DUF488 domain-containing protein [Microcystis elabens FACHB-917]|nr:DUF488 domain-containing protein [Microcystis elabens FACHB-917]